jgi:ABC-type multidrug transport system ATPase subunit
MSMTESILKALMRLFAIVTQIHPEDKLKLCRAIVGSYLMQLVRPAKVNQYLIMFDFYHSSLREREVKTGQKQISLFSVKAIIICEHINKVLDKEQKLLVLMQLLEILNVNEDVNKESIDFVHTIAIAFKFDNEVFNNCKSFILDTLHAVPRKEDILIADSNASIGLTGIKHIYREYLKGKVIFLTVPSAHAYFFRNIESDDKLYYKGHEVVPNRTYYLEKGTAIKSPLVGTIYYSDIVKEFLSSKIEHKLLFSVEGAQFRFKNSKDGIHEFTLYEESGQMVGIMGGSGVGKSTLLNLLNGNLKPRKGRILINGYDVHREKEQLRGIIGFIPQDDLLVEELTVYENLYFNARLCFRDYSEDEIVLKIHKILVDLDLYEVRKLKVGNPLNKFISGGQRKRLNIALELIREPFVLFVDEPTSGLSSSDSGTVIDLLKEQSLKGKLLIVNIHQPSSEIYKQFDKLIVMDKGGRIVFHGNPLDALIYFKTESQLINAEDGECPTCGNVSPEQVLQILESKKVNDFGDYISERQVTPEQWHSDFKKNIEPEINPGAEILTDLPSNDFKIPNRKTQFKIFLHRNFLSKLSDKQYLLINLLEAPLLAFILGWFTKYNAGTPDSPGLYLFSENVNLPVYIFMSVIVALFLGLMVSAEEIIRDRKIIQREAFLNLSRFSYFNSKVFILVVLSAIQSMLFVFIGNRFLQIEGMFFHYWAILFVTSVFANILGLNISSAMKSVVSIYILIPLLLVPQILLGGAMIRFDKLNSKLNNPKYVPIVGDMMQSRWAYEALAVHQFKNNHYQRNFFDMERNASDASFKLNFLLPELLLKLNNVERNIKLNSNLQETEKYLQILKNEVVKLGLQINDIDFSFARMLNPTEFNLAVSNRTRNFLNDVRKHYSKVLDDAVDKKDLRLLELKNKLGGTSQLISFKQKYQNNSLEELVLNKRETVKIEEYKNQLIRRDEPAYKAADMFYGRAHFFAPEKTFLGLKIDTYWFNLLVLLLMSVVLYLLLILEVIKNIMDFIGTYRISDLVKTYFNNIASIIKPIIKKI